MVVVGVEEDAVEGEGLGEDDEPAEELPEHAETGVLLPGQRGPLHRETLARVLQQQPLDSRTSQPGTARVLAVHPELDQQLAAVGIAEDPHRLAERVVELEVHQRRLEPARADLLQDPEPLEQSSTPTFEKYSGTGCGGALRGGSRPGRPR